MFKIGKIPSEMLEMIVMDPIRNKGVKRTDILVRPKTGEDCSVVDLQGELCVLSTDPITGAESDIGYLAVQVNCNDIYSAGAEPIGILLTILLPEGSEECVLNEIMQGALKGADELGIEILGGHTEVTDAVCKPIVSVTVIGKTQKRQLIQTGGAKVGQDVIMTKWAGLEGTAIIAKEHEAVLANKIPLEVIQAAQGMKDFLSVEKESKIAFKHGATAMHDATEGGILGAVWEVAACSEIGVEIWEDHIPLKAVTKIICEHANIDPLRLISSGTMIITTDDGEGLVKELLENGIEAATIGKMTPKERILVTASEGVSGKTQEKRLLDEPKSDELYQVKFL